MITKLVIFGIIALPWVIIPLSKIADPFRLPKASFFDILCLGVLATCFTDSFRFIYRNKYLSWLLMWVFATVFMTWYIPFTNTLNNQQTIPFFTLEPTIHVVLSTALLLVLLSYLTKNDFTVIAKAICVSATAVTVFGILQCVGIDPAVKLFKYTQLAFHSKFTAFLSHPTLAGCYLAISVPFFFAFMSKKKYRICLLLVIAGIFLSRSKMAMLSLSVSAGLWVFLTSRNRKRIVVFLLIIICLLPIAVVVNFNKTDLLYEFSGRVHFWQDLMKYAKTNPLFGQGLGILKTFNLAYGGKNLANAHSDWVELTIEIGLIGLFLFILVVINAFKNFTYKNRLGFSYLCSFVTFLILMTGLFPMRFAPIALVGIIGFCGVEKL